MAKYATANGKGKTPAGYNVITTSRHTPYDPEMSLDESINAKVMLIEETQKNWDMVVSWLANGRGEGADENSASEWNKSEAAEVTVYGKVVSPDGWHMVNDAPLPAYDPLVDVWAYNYPLTVTSNCDPRDAYVEAFCWMKAHKWVGEKRIPGGNVTNGNKSEPAPQPAPQRRVGVVQKPDPIVEAAALPASSAGLPDGVIWANQDIDYGNRRAVQYENGQGVAYRISEINLDETQIGKPVVKLRSPQGLHTVFCLDFKDVKRSPDFAKLVTDGMGLPWIETKYRDWQEHGETFSRSGNWILIMKIVHSDKTGDRVEYKNVASLTATAQAEVTSEEQPF